MHANLISYSQPAGRIYAGEPAIKGLDNIQDLIAYCARVSNPSNQANTKTTAKLLDYLIKHKHWSPFEMASACLEITTTRDIARQFLRHRSFSFQEFSQRYAEATELEPIEWRMQGATNRQVGDEPADLAEDAQQAIRDLNETALEIYGLLTKQGVAKESARMILPLTTKTTLYMKGSIRSWIHYVLVRATQETQKEHRDIALAIKKVLKQHFPDVCKALDW